MGQRNPIIALGAAIAAICVATVEPALAAPVTWADPAGVCAGHAPCFTTLGAAVANAGPAPATVFAFPGTFAESLDPTQMGSAIGGSPGALAMVSVDGTGTPAPGAVIDPGALGGPGTGSAIRAVAFPASLTIDGFVLRSPDDSALGLFFSTGPVVLRHLVASGNPGGSGIRAIQDPSAGAALTASDLRTDGNLDDGIHLVAVHLVATDLSARNNGERGVRLGGQHVTAERLVAEGNATVGVEVAVGDGVATFAVRDVTVRGNQTGLVVTAATATTSATGTVDDVDAASNANLGVVVQCDAVTASALTATQNGLGIAILGKNLISATGLIATANAEGGIAVVAPEVRLASSVADGNLRGIGVGGDRVVLEGCTATNNGPPGPDPFDGAGFVVAARLLDAHGNTASGNQVGWIFDDEDPLATTVSRQSIEGGAPPPQRLAMLRTLTEGNLAASMRVRLREAGRLTVGCSSFVANAPPGLELLTDHTVDARSNFWGAPSGPSHPGNPGGTGDGIRDAANGGAGSVLYAGFLAAPPTDSDCPALPILDVPALGPAGLYLMAALLALAGVRRLVR